MRLAKLKHFSIGLSRNYLFKHIKATPLAKKMLTWTQPQYVKKDCVQKYNIFLFFFFKLGFTPCKAEEPLRRMELHTRKRKRLKANQK